LFFIYVAKIIYTRLNLSEQTHVLATYNIAFYLAIMAVCQIK